MGWMFLKLKYLYKFSKKLKHAHVNILEKAIFLVREFCGLWALLLVDFLISQTKFQITQHVKSLFKKILINIIWAINNVIYTFLLRTMECGALIFWKSRQISGGLPPI